MIIELDRMLEISGVYGDLKDRNIYDFKYNVCNKKDAIIICFHKYVVFRDSTLEGLRNNVRNQHTILQDMITKLSWHL